MSEYGMFPEGGNIVAGVSGGADSVCLLRVLVELRKERNFTLTVVHVNHRMRKEAGEDAVFVRDLCEQWHVPFVLVEEDVEALAAREHLSCEEAGRQVRYQAFLQVLQETCGDKGKGCIAVAHNRNDRAETLLFHLFRGTGLRGMGSIRPIRTMESEFRLIRPLLFAGRDEIEAFLNNEGISWCTDATNSGDLYTRNRIRNRILPCAEALVCERAGQHLAREAQLLAETSDFVGRMAKTALERCCMRNGDKSLCFDTAAFAKEDPFLQKQMIWQGMTETGSGRDLTEAHAEQIRRLFAADCQSGKKVELASLGLSVQREFDKVVFRRVSDSADLLDQPMEMPEIPLQEGTLRIPGLGVVEAKILKASGEMQGRGTTFLQDIPEKTYTKWIDYDKITESAMFRFRRVGDFLTINGAGAKKSLKRYMIEEKIPANRRDKLVILADGAHVIWVPGHRISAAYRITEQTARVLQINLTGGQENGREN